MEPLSLETLKHQLLQLQELHQAGVLSEPQYAEARTALEKRIVDAVLQAVPVAPVAAPASPLAPASIGTGTASAPVSAAPDAPKARPSWRLWAGVLSFSVVVAGAGYWWKGTPQALSAGSAPAPAAAGQDGSPTHSTDNQQMAAMVDKLAERLKSQPKDGEGWAMLARSYNAMGRSGDAVAAYEKAVAILPKDANLLADYADALAVRNNRTLDGEPMKLVARALKIDPVNMKALALAGSYAFEKKDYRTAVREWEKLVQNGPADHPMVQQMRGALDEARTLAGMPAAAPAAAPAALAPMGGKSGAGAPAGSITGNVSLSPALKAQTQPTDTVFVFARAVEGPRMPMAIVRKQVKDLPFAFTLDDSTAMSPANKLSGAKKVIVGARVSRSGNAMPQPGDLSAQSGPVDVGSRNLQIEINTKVPQ